MHPALRIVLASFASAIGAMFVLALTLPLYAYLASPGERLGPLGDVLAGTLIMAPFVILVGGTIALPVAFLTGGGLLLWEKSRGQLLDPRIWLVAGLAVGTAVSPFLGVDDPLTTRLAMALWFAASGASGAWIFRRVWGPERL